MRFLDKRLHRLEENDIGDEVQEDIRRDAAYPRADIEDAKSLSWERGIGRSEGADRRRDDAELGDEIEEELT